jgi:hypothetical protein
MPGQLFPSGQQNRLNPLAFIRDQRQYGNSHRALDDQRQFKRSDTTAHEDDGEPHPCAILLTI